MNYNKFENTERKYSNRGNSDEATFRTKSEARAADEYGVDNREDYLNILVNKNRDALTNPEKYILDNETKTSQEQSAENIAKMRQEYEAAKKEAFDNFENKQKQKTFDVKYDFSFDNYEKSQTSDESTSPKSFEDNLRDYLDIAKKNSEKATTAETHVFNIDDLVDYSSKQNTSIPLEKEDKKNIVAIEDLFDYKQPNTKVITLDQLKDSDGEKTDVITINELVDTKNKETEPLKKSFFSKIGSSVINLKEKAESLKESFIGTYEISRNFGENRLNSLSFAANSVKNDLASSLEYKNKDISPEEKKRKILQKIGGAMLAIGLFAGVGYAYHTQNNENTGANERYHTTITEDEKKEIEEQQKSYYENNSQEENQNQQEIQDIEQIEFSQAAKTIEYNEGLFNTMSEMGIPQDKQRVAMEEMALHPENYPNITTHFYTAEDGNLGFNNVGELSLEALKDIYTASLKV